MTLPVDTSAEKVTTIGGRMRTAREALKLTQEALATRIGSSKRGIQDNETRNTVPGGEVLAGFVALGINANWLLTGEGEMRVRPSEADRHIDEVHTGHVAIPLYDDVRVSADGTLTSSEPLDHMVRFSEAWLRAELRASPQDLYLIRVTGDSMEPTLRSGDAILVDRRHTTPNREAIYVIRCGDALLVRRIQVLTSGGIRLVSENPLYGPEEIAPDQAGSMQIVGRVVWWIRRL